MNWVRPKGTKIDKTEYKKKVVTEMSLSLGLAYQLMVLSYDENMKDNNGVRSDGWSRE